MGQGGFLMMPDPAAGGPLRRNRHSWRTHQRVEFLDAADRHLRSCELLLKPLGLA